MNHPEEPRKKKQDCANQVDCLKMLQAVLDGDVTPEEREHFLREHLENCLPCYQNYSLEVVLREKIKRNCCSEAPHDLAEAIKQKVGQLPPH